MKLQRVSTIFRKQDEAQSSPKSTGKNKIQKLFTLKGETKAIEDTGDNSFIVQNVVEALEKFAHVVHLAHRPMPTTTADGTYSEDKHMTGLLKDIASLGPEDLKALQGVLSQELGDTTLVDDKSMFMEKVMQLLAALPSSSANRFKLTNTMIGELWNSLPHPPQSMLGEKYRYRQADGSFNNIQFPDIGKSGQAYARSVAPHIVQPNPKPDPGLIFDMIMSRENTGFKEHPNKVSSVLYYFATIIIHDCFRTSREDCNVSTTSSYLDLSPLYGTNQQEQNSMRVFADGKIKPDCFSEKRLLGFPPGVGCILIMFNRFHNYVVEQLALINENGRFSKPRHGMPVEHQKSASIKLDNALFQTGRLITCGLYVNIILADYFRTIIGLNRVKSDWNIDPRDRIDEPSTPRATGNQVSCEFNLLYRWHSCTSQRDEEWTKDMYLKVFGKESQDVTREDFFAGLAELDRNTPDDPLQRSYPSLHRGASGNFADDDLAALLTNSIEDVAGAFGANNVPEVMRAIEVLGIEQSRAWNVATLNEFRTFFGLNPHKTFEDINPDPIVATKLKALFNHPDFVELYPGLVCEETKKPMNPGVGIAPPYTISRVILSDAITLIRGDRFYTVDYNSAHLTNWGLREVANDVTVNQGCVFYKLILRALPHHFKYNSIYAHFPMTVPSENRTIMDTLGRGEEFDWDKPQKTTAMPVVAAYDGVKSVLTNTESFSTEPWAKGIRFLFGKPGSNFMLAGDGDFFLGRREQMSKCLYQENWGEIFRAFFETTTLDLLKEWSTDVGNGTKQVDIIRDVGNSVFTYFAASMFSLPLKTDATPHAVFTEHELYGILSLMFVVVFFGDADPATTFPLHVAAVPLTQGIAQLMEHIVGFLAKADSVPKCVDRKPINALHEYSYRAIRHLLDRGLSVHEAVWSQIIPTAVAMVPHIAAVFGQIIDFYLGDGSQHLPEINRLAKINTSESDSVILRYVLEGMRLTGTFGALRTCKKDTLVHDGSKELLFKEGQTVFCTFAAYSHNANLYPEPETVKLDRPIDNYHLHGAGPHECLGQLFTRVALTAMLKVVASLDGLRRAPGSQGQIKKIINKTGATMYMDATESRYFPFPTGLKIHWNGELNEASHDESNAVMHERLNI